MQDLYGFVYMTENLVNGKRYIGQRSYQKKGWEDYLGSGKLLKIAIRKYGVSSFVRTILFQAESKEQLDLAERRLIAEHNAVENRMFYNLVPGGHGCSFGFAGKKHTTETRSKMSAAAAGHSVSDHVREAVSKAQKGKTISEERRAQQSLVRGSLHPRSVSVTVCGIEYPTIALARKETGISYREAQRLIKASRSLP
jgi:group I intron endonuclease